jgi:hypothetical protein
MTPLAEQQIRDKIEVETILIKKLESTVPKLVYPNELYHRSNTPYHIHVTKIMDAYWRRRMLRTQLEGGNLQECAKIG